MSGRARQLVATGLITSACLVSAVGGWWGWTIGAMQAALAVAVALRPRSALPLAAAVLALVPAPLAAVRHWTADLPGGCGCARLAHPPPGLISLTGLAVALDVLLLVVTIWLIARSRNSEVGKTLAMTHSDRTGGQAP